VGVEEREKQQHDPWDTTAKEKTTRAWRYLALFGAKGLKSLFNRRFERRLPSIIFSPARSFSGVN
jgi:hypothetical protein